MKNPGYHYVASLAAWALVVAAQSSALAAGWFDDFNDGNATDGSPVTWETNASGFFPGVLDASSGDYILSAPDDGNDNSSIEASINQIFTDTYIRTQAVVLPGEFEDEVGGTMGVWARYDPANVTGYLALLSNAPGSGHLELLRLDPGVNLVTIDEVRGLEVDTSEDAIIELNVVGDLLSVFLWRPGDPKPETPVLSVNDSTFASGRAGILYNENDDFTQGLFRFAAAQDTPFIDVQPVVGDYDADGDVDGFDFLVWEADYGSTENLAADGDDSGTVDDADYSLWAGAFGTLAPGASVATAVPEPSAIALVVLATLAACGRLQRRYAV